MFTHPVIKRWADEIIASRPFLSVEESENLTAEEKEYKGLLHAVQCGIDRAKTKLAWYMLSGRGGAIVDADGAVLLLEERVKDGDTKAMWILGVCNEYGLGTETSIERAELLYCQSRDKGNTMGGICLENGKKNGRGNGILTIERL